MGTAAPRESPRGSSNGGAANMSIGEVLGRLRPEFPDITISKLRFLEAEGLVEPLRTPSGYRKYSTAHLDQLRFILAAQRDRYLPLKVIREQLEAAQRGHRILGPPPQPGTPPTPVVDVAVTASLVGQRAPARQLGDARMTRAQLIERSGIKEAGLADLEQYGLLGVPPNGFY